MSRAATWRSNIAGRMITTIGCRRWRPIWSAAVTVIVARRRRRSPGRQGRDHDDSDRLLASATTRSSWAWSTA